MHKDSLSSSLIIQNALLASKLSRRVGSRLNFQGISLTEYLVMHYLASAPSNAVTRIELAEHLGMSASGVTRLVAPMIKIKLVEKESNPRDARQSLVKLSKTGQRVFSETSVSFEHISRDALDKLSESQQAKLAELYEKLR